MKCHSSEKPVPAMSSVCPVTTIQPVTTINPTPLSAEKPATTSVQIPIYKKKLAHLQLSATALSPMFPKSMNKKERTAVLSKAEGLANFLIHHGMKDDVVQFVVGVHMLVPRRSRIDWSKWFSASKEDRRPPLWWRIMMLIVVSKGAHYLQMTKISGGTSCFIDVMQTAEWQGSCPNLDIWMWDTAAVLQVLQTNLFTEKICQAATVTIADFRNKMGHFNADMSFGKCFECIGKLLGFLGCKHACDEVETFHTQVRSWFPALDVTSKLRQSRERPLMLTAKQYHEFRKYVLDPEGNISANCRLRFQCGASGGKTVMATILCVEFAKNATTSTDKVLLLVHAPLLASRTAQDLSDQLELKMCYSTLISKQRLKKVKMRGPVNKDDPCVYRIAIDGNDKIVVATINAALDSLIDEVFLAGIVVDEAHIVYGANRQKGATIGQCRRSAREIAPIIERWGGARDAADVAKRLVLFGDERNQSARRRFTDAGSDLVRCDGCFTLRLPCWMENKFNDTCYSRVEKLFLLLDNDGDGKLSQDEFEFFLEKTGLSGFEDWTSTLKKLHTNANRFRRSVLPLQRIQRQFRL